MGSYKGRKTSAGSLPQSHSGCSVVSTLIFFFKHTISPSVKFDDNTE